MKAQKVLFLLLQIVIWNSEFSATPGNKYCLTARNRKQDLVPNPGQHFKVKFEQEEGIRPEVVELVSRIPGKSTFWMNRFKVSSRQELEIAKKARQTIINNLNKNLINNDVVVCFKIGSHDEVVFNQLRRLFISELKPASYSVMNRQLNQIVQRVPFLSDQILKFVRF